MIDPYDVLQDLSERLALQEQLTELLTAQQQLQQEQMLALHRELLRISLNIKKDS